MVVVCVLLGKRLVEDYIAYNNPKIYMTMSTQKTVTIILFKCCT